MTEVSETSEVVRSAVQDRRDSLADEIEDSERQLRRQDAVRHANAHALEIMCAKLAELDRWLEAHPLE